MFIKEKESSEVKTQFNMEFIANPPSISTITCYVAFSSNVTRSSIRKRTPTQPKTDV
jgi:hypothetical protein